MTPTSRTRSGNGPMRSVATRKTWPSWPSCDAPAQLEQRGVEALDVADGGVDAGRRAGVDERAAPRPRWRPAASRRARGRRAPRARSPRRRAPRWAPRRSRSRAARRAAARRVEPNTSAASRTAPKRSPPGSTAPANATRGEACSSRAWWRPIMPSPSTAPRSGLVESGLGTAALGYPPCPITPPPVSSSARRPPSAATSASAPMSSSTTASSSATASSSRTTPCSASRRGWRRPRGAPRTELDAARHRGRCCGRAPGRSSSPARTSARGAIVGDQSFVRERTRVGPNSVIGRGSAIDNDVVVGARVQASSPTST